MCCAPRVIPAAPHTPHCSLVPGFTPCWCRPRWGLHLESCWGGGCRGSVGWGAGAWHGAGGDGGPCLGPSHCQVPRLPEQGALQRQAVPGLPVGTSAAAVGTAEESGCVSAGFLRPESSRAAAGEEAPAESLLPPTGWARAGLCWGGEGWGGVGWGPHAAPGQDVATSPFPWAGAGISTAPEWSRPTAFAALSWSRAMLAKWGPVPVPPPACPWERTPRGGGNAPRLGDAGARGCPG